MADREFIQPPKNLIPRWVGAFDAVAQKVGLSVSAAITRSNYSSQDELTSIWRGTRKQMRATVFLTPSYHFPLGCCPFRNSMIQGRMHVGRGVVWAEIWWGALPCQIKDAEGVQIITYDTETVFHGTAEALESMGVCPACDLPMGARTKKSIRDEDRRNGKGPPWEAQRLHDDTFIFTRTDEAEWRRLQKEYPRSYGGSTSRAPSAENNQMVAQAQIVATQSDAAFERFMQRATGGDHHA